jgi:hypothetical protein
MLKAPKILTSFYMRLSKKHRLQRWRMGVLLGCLSSSIVLSCNIVLLAVGAATRSGYDNDGVATIFEGDEATISLWNTILHVVINVLSTLLLSASNYTMQVLNSPTREEINKAHKNGKWLDIGLLSVHNLRIISSKRAILCIVLALTSTPLHLL